MSIAHGIGQSGRVATYELPDDQLAVGSTLGGPKVTTIIKANGAIEKVYSVDFGESLFGTVILRHYDARTRVNLAQEIVGSYVIHAEYQEHSYTLPNKVAVKETVFVLNGGPGEDDAVDPPGVYQLVEMRNDGAEAVEVATYAFAVLRGTTGHDVTAAYDDDLHALTVWNAKNRDQVRLFGCSIPAESWETTLDYAKAVSESCPDTLACTTTAPVDPLGVLQHTCSLQPGERVEYYYLLSFGKGRKQAKKNYQACPPAREALDRTMGYYHEILSRSVVLTPDKHVNRGVLWAKANMLRVQNKAPTGWSFTNDPTRSNNSVARDTAWFAFGADYLTPDFARESLRHYVKLQEKSGMIIEYYDIRNDKTADYGLNINDNTPLLIIALWHHYNATGNIEFLREVYPASVKAARYILSQRNEQGLVWATATGTSDWGIVGWRNVIPDYRLSGATTEVNSECLAALRTISHMARVLDEHDTSAEFAAAAAGLRDAINEYLLDPETQLYYLHIDLDGHPRSDVTSDLVFPVMFGAAGDHVAANIIGRLSSEDFWTTAGIRTSPRDAPNYTPSGAWGLLGGVWVGVSFWYAFAAARHSPAFMAHALSTSFHNYSSNPKQNNTVPGQFSEWLNGETLVNEGMMLSPWFPPRYLWAAIEGVAGFDIERGDVTISPRLPPDWKWMAVQNLPHRGQWLSWFAARMPNLRIFATFASTHDDTPFSTYEEDITRDVDAAGDAICTIGLKHHENLVLFVGNTAERTSTTSVRVRRQLSGRYRLQTYNSLLSEWIQAEDNVSPEHISRGITVKLERKGFCVLQLEQVV